MDGTVRIWDVATGICTGEFGDHDGIGISRIAMNSSYLMSFSDQNETLVIRDFEKGKVILKISNFDDQLLPGLAGVRRSVYSTGKFEIGDIIAPPEDRSIMITSESKRIRVWDLR
jgi:WD40 repeat protein